MFGVVAIVILGTRLAQSLSVPSQTQNHLLILGLGRVGREVARQARNTRNFEIIVGTVRQDERDTEDATHSIPFENTDEILQTARLCKHVLITIPPSNDEEENIAAYCKFQTVLKELPACCWIGILSTTGVYGNHDGKWVTEATTCEPASSTANRYLAYEDVWKERAKLHSLRIFRCAGIYSPDQSALQTVFKSGLPIGKEESETADLANRIHVHDLAAAIVASMKQHNRDENSNCHIYNLADDLPESRAVVMAFAAQLLQSIGVSIMLAPTTNEGGRARRRRMDAKRVSNRKMKQELVGKLKYPTYKEGLADILQYRRNPWYLLDD
jgi:nucleoside-diphosphate-sugar epimerase